MKQLLRYPLRKDPQFFRVAHKKFGKHCLVYTHHSQDHHYYAVICSKKTFPLATKRNKCKRKLRALLQQLVHNKPAKIVLVIPKKTALTVSMTELYRDLEKVVYGV